MLLFFLFYCHGDHRDLHSFPTRRSSDLGAVEQFREAIRTSPEFAKAHFSLGVVMEAESRHREAIESFSNALKYDTGYIQARSEEHTSELQSRQYLVCRLLLEKKKKANQK